MKKIILTVFGIAFLAINLFGAKVETPKPNEAKALGVNYISIEDAKKALDSGAVFLDNRNKKKFLKGKIKGAVTAIYREKGGNKNRISNFNKNGERLTMKNIPKDKNTKLITYCSSINCWKSFKAAVTLSAKGYKNVYWMRDGFVTWRKAKLPTE